MITGIHVKCEHPKCNNFVAYEIAMAMKRKGEKVACYDHKRFELKKEATSKLAIGSPKGSL